MQRLPSLLTEVDQWVESPLQGNLHGGFGGGSGETSERKRALLLPYLPTAAWTTLRGAPRGTLIEWMENPSALTRREPSRWGVARAGCKARVK
jgi:hypothetical protein